MRIPALILCLLAGLGGAQAAPPPGHPSPAQTMDMLLPQRPPTPAELPHSGKVLKAMDANEFTYLEVSDGKTARWIAGPKTAVTPGATVRYSDGAVMRNFQSKLLKRSFDSVMFVDHVVVGGK